MAHIHISKKISIAIFCSLLLIACNKFLDIKPKGYKLLTTVSDYDQWLNDPKLFIFNPANSLLRFSDINDQLSITVPPSAQPYIWSEQFTGASFDLWGMQYDNISTFNSVIVGIGSATEGTEKQKKSLMAEALLGRAFEYFYLVNEYGKSYDSTTASQDPAVPFIATDDVSQIVPPRNSVQEIYDHIIADITTALPDLPLDNSLNRYRGSVAGGYSLLAKVYQNQHRYGKAREYAQLALKNSPGQGLLNYNDYATTATIPKVAIRPDAIYARYFASTNYVTIEHLRSFKRQDNRLRLFYYPLGDTTFPKRANIFWSWGGPTSNGTTDNGGTSIQEMKLIIAEGAARNNDLTEALKELDELRKNRIRSSSYQPYQSNNKDSVFKWVLDERRFEFSINGHRWLDMRRLDAEGLMPAVNRLDAQGNIIATLAPHSPRYTLQVPDPVLQYNPAMVQNP